MADHMDIFNDIVSGGFSAPMLADVANGKDQKFASEGERFVAHLSQFQTITVQAKMDKDYSNRTLNIITDDALCEYHGTGQVQVPVTLGEWKVEIRANLNGVNHYLGPVRTMDDAAKFPEESVTDLVKGREVTVPFTIAGEATWNGKLAQRLSASEIRSSMLDAVKTAVKTAGTGECDVFILRCNVASRKGDIDTGTLGKGSFQDFARLFFSVGKNADDTRRAIENQIAHDFGLKNVDDLLCVIIAASDLYKLSFTPQGRYPLAEFANYYQVRLRDARDSGKLGGEVRSKKDLQAFIEFLGGKMR
jgi:hypothetical protein